jgi:hypothetical protein
VTVLTDCPLPPRTREYYGWKVMWIILPTFYTAIAGGARAIECLFKVAG